MKTIRTITCAWVFLVAALPAAAQQRPLVTEDPETVGANHVLVEGGVEFDKDQFFPTYGLNGDVTHIATLGVSVGVSPNVELQADWGLLQRLHVTSTVPVALSSTLSITDDTSSTVEDMTVATKIRIVPESERHPGFGVRFGTKLPLASRSSGLGLGTTDFFATVLAAKTVQSVRTVGNASLLVLGDPASGVGSVRALGFGFSIARAVTNEFEAVGEINGHLEPFGDVTPPGLESRGVLRLAGRYTRNLLRLDFGILLGITPRDPSFGVSGGATYVFNK